MKEKITYQEEYWDNALEAVQFEENWLDALHVLKKTERKIFVRKALPYVVVLFIGLGLILTNLNTNNNTALALKNKGNISFTFKKTTNPIDQKNNGRIIKNETAINTTSKGTVPSTKTIIKKSIDLINQRTGINSIAKHSQAYKNIVPSPKTAINNSTLTFEEEENTIYTKDNKLNTALIYEKVERLEKTEKLTKPNVDNSVKEVTKPTFIDWKYLPLIATYQNNITSDVNYINPKPLFNPKKGKVSMLLGVNLISKYGNIHNRLNPNLEVGIAYDYLVSKKIVVATGINYFSIEGINHELSHSDITLSYGRKETKTTFSSTKLHYLHTPLTIGYKINPNHLFKMGVAISYFLTNNSSIQTEIIENGITTSDETMSVRGFSEGYKTLNYSLNLGYEMLLNPNNSIGFSYQHGLSDVTDNQYYSPYFDRNSRLELIYKRRIR